MQYYLMLVFAAVMCSVQFVFIKYFQKIRGASVFGAVFFTACAFAVMCFLALCINLFHVQFTWFSFGIAIPYAICIIVMMVFSIKALEYVELSFYSMFTMLGGMLLPFFYGLCIGEKMTAMKGVGLVFIAIAMLLTVKSGKKLSLKATLYYIAVFVLNGTFGIYTKIHQSGSMEAVGSLDFIILYSGLVVVMSLIILPILYKISGGMQAVESGKARFFSIASTAGYACLNGGANFILLTCAIKLDASVQYPILTGGCIFFSAIFGLLFGEKVTIKVVLSILSVILGTVMFMF